MRGYQKHWAFFFNDNLLRSNYLNNFNSFFEYLYNKTINKRLVIAIDEFPYIVKNNNSLLSILQDCWDNKLKYTKIFFIISGSNMSMMENIVIYKSPVYGRRTGQLMIKPLEFMSLIDYFGNVEKAIKYYSVYGGTPAYINGIDKTEGLMENIKNNFLSINSFINQDIMFLLREEFNEPRYYFSILEAIANENTALGEIINYTGLERSLLGKYISVLIDTDFIKREIPVTLSSKSKKGIYRFKDNMIAFFFRYIYNNYDFIEMNRVNELSDIIKNDLDTYIGHTFEDISINFLIKNNGRIIKFDKIGKWWYKDSEIDIVALNNLNNEIIFFECKWKTLSDYDVNNILLKLKDKAKNVKWKNSRKEKFGVIAKEIINKERIDKNYIVIDLRDFQ